LLQDSSRGWKLPNAVDSSLSSNNDAPRQFAGRPLLS
jgi:hypothetical protein